MKNIDDEEVAMEYIDTVDDIVNMQKMTAYFEKPDWQMLKTVIYKLEKSSKYVWISLRGDLNVNEIKFKKFITEKYDDAIVLANEADLENIGTVRGFISPLKDARLNVDFYGDESLKSVKNFFGWANALSKSTKNVNIRDLNLQEFWDFNEPKVWFTSQNVEWEELEFKKACEVWNIFHLWTKYTEPFWVSYLDANNKMIDTVEMWCYGIGVSRLMWVMAEYFMTEKWIAWPDDIAPYDYSIIVIWEQNLETATNLGKKLESEWKSVILDDRMWRKDGFWQKMWDAELWGVPNKIIISPKTLEQWGYELQKRGGETEIVKL